MRWMPALKKTNISCYTLLSLWILTDHLGESSVLAIFLTPDVYRAFNLQPTNFQFGLQLILG